ncbi:MAG TPA: UDP-3-O-(3-hydroxymyristoyl)glucosamine N-acyltransferase [Burkholderiales bacterium]|nr:UDP-3-O-(3-hydroxymyristoyl)glucosamine N-acyltransferase [Burkholderiales bacterium]
MAAALTLDEIAGRLGGRVEGDGTTRVHQVGSLQGAVPGEIAFLASPRHRHHLAATRASAVILAAEAEALTALPRIVCEQPALYFARLSQLFNPLTTQPEGIHPSAVVAAGARLGARVSIGAGCVIGEGVQIGDDSCLYPRVVVYPGCTLGRRVIVHAGAVIGADGFGIVRDAEGRWIKVPQIGAVRIGDDVEIGANTTIDRGALDDTVIEEGVKLDNLVQIGHNARIGAHTAMAGCAGVAGSAVIGRHCTLGGAANVLGHLSLADHVNVSAGTMISRSIRQAGTYTGLYPFDENKAWARNTALVRHLADLAERLRTLERKEKKNG